MRSAIESMECRVDDFPKVVEYILYSPHPQFPWLIARRILNARQLRIPLFTSNASFMRFDVEYDQEERIIKLSYVDGKLVREEVKR
jgi:hypothetical protein